MEREIAYARAAGIDYWAFVMYAPGDAMSKGLGLYLASPHRSDVRFAMIVQPYTAGEDDIARLVGYLALENYQKTPSGRPIVFLLGPNGVGDTSWTDAKKTVPAIRAAAARAGVPAPYVVHQWGWADQKELARGLGADAVGAYSWNFDDHAAPYALLAAKAEGKWDESAALGLHVVPLATAGWDRRPRVANPVSWERPNPPGAETIYYATPTAAELAGHVKHAIDWCAHHGSPAGDASDAACDANAVLVYAWNEIDEGGWLLPSRAREPGTARLDAIAAVLRTWHP
jgi:hypothetical protein